MDKVTLVKDPSKNNVFAIKKGNAESKCALAPPQVFFIPNAIAGGQPERVEFQPYCHTGCMKCNVSNDGKKLEISCCGFVDTFYIEQEEPKIKTMFSVE